MERKLALLIVEGGSDGTALTVPIRNYLVNNGNCCFFEYVVYSADITLHENGCNEINYDYENVVDRVSKAVDEYLNSDYNTNKYTIDDVGIVMTLSDLDACYCSNEQLVFGGPGCSTIVDCENKKVLCNDVIFMSKRNETKVSALGILSSEEKIKFSNKLLVPFHAFYCGTNLEHALYNDYSLHTFQEKMTLAREWASVYKKDHKAFYNAINEIPRISDDYKESWLEKKLFKVPFDRISNLKNMIDWIIEQSELLSGDEAKE